LTFLGRDICLIEWCTNLGAISEPRVLFICAPIKLKGTDGAPCRVMAIEGLL
jgi:kynurenine formamidase